MLKRIVYRLNARKRQK